ncbi:hypothetical protein HFO56_24145 [Rhizobium laguerreae]|uniref:hypothetical protein n=1 Tax=Rhizobium laguerreae TaxID=1076926 RepID=UPI001C91D652|nr:hypothetical protein [Rhizobium laguerreae]MBY3155421.1 hypothetical protein [Rhizobium laguerreae]
MILLPSRYLPVERCLVYIGGEVIDMLSGGPLFPWCISQRVNEGRECPDNFDTVALALAFLYAIGAVARDGEAIVLALNIPEDNANGA